MNKQIVVVSLIALALCGIIGQVANATFARVSGTPASSNGERYFYGQATDGQDIFYGASTNPVILVKFSGATNERAGALSLTGFNGMEGAMTSFGGNIFLGDCSGSPTKVVKVAASTLTGIATLTLPAGDTCAYAMVNDGSTYAYLASWGPGSIVKIKMSDLTRVSAVQLVDSDAQALAIDAQHIYVAMDNNNNNKQITRVVLSTFLEDNAILFEDNEYYAYGIVTDSVASACTYVYAGMEVYPGIIVKVSCSPFKRVSALTLHAVEYIYYLAIDSAFDSIYAISDTSPFTVAQVKLSDFSVVTTVVADLNDGYAYYMTCVGNSLFVGTDENPASSVKFSIDVPPPRPNATEASLSVGALESKIVVAALVVLMSVVFVMA